MPPAIFVARLLGPTMVAIGAGMLVNSAIYQVVIGQFLASYALIYFAGVLALVGGLAILNVHNSWTGGWPVVITVFGWLLVIGGVVRIVAPFLTKEIGTALYTGQMTIAIFGMVSIAFGAFLIIKGYVQKPQPGSLR